MGHRERFTEDNEIRLTFACTPLQYIRVFLRGPHEESEVLVEDSKPVGIMGERGPHISAGIHLQVNKRINR